MLIQDPDVCFRLMMDIHEYHKFVSYDLETTGLNPFKGDRLCGVALYIPVRDGSEFGGDSYYLPFRHLTGKNLPPVALEWLSVIMKDKDRTLIGWNLKFDVHFTEIEGIKVECRHKDAMLGAHLANENELSFRLKAWMAKYWQANANDTEKALMLRLKEEGIDGKAGMDALNPAEVHEYAEMDTVLAWNACGILEQALHLQGLRQIWDEVNQYSTVIQKMEFAGLKVNLEDLEISAEEAIRKADELRVEMFRVAGCEFNPNSHVQLKKLLGLPSTREEILEGLDHPLAISIIKYRAWFKANSTYFGPFRERSDASGRLHPNLKLHGTISGRLSCSEPNLQALPRNTDEYRVRRLIVANPGKKLIKFDYSQAELRLLAHYTNDPFLVEAYTVTGRDLHQMVAEILGWERDDAKHINFMMVYGGGVEVAKRKTKKSRLECEEILQRYHNTIPGIRQFARKCEAAAKRQGYISMWTGRRRHYKDHDSYHKAMSNTIQGGVAEIMRVSSLRVEDIISRNYLDEAYGIKMLMQVHDEILFEVNEEDTMTAIDWIKPELENYNFRVPIRVDCAVGDNWGEMEKIP